MIGPVIERAVSGGGKLDKVCEAFFGEPGLQLLDGMVRLVPRGVPIEVIADSQGPVGVV